MLGLPASFAFYWGQAVKINRQMTTRERNEFRICTEKRNGRKRDRSERELECAQNKTQRRKKNMWMNHFGNLMCFFSLARSLLRFHTLSRSLSLSLFSLTNYILHSNVNQFWVKLKVIDFWANSDKNGDTTIEYFSGRIMCDLKCTIFYLTFSFRATWKRFAIIQAYVCITS